MSRYPQVPLGEILTPSNDAVEVQPDESYRLAGIYSFGRGLFPREPVSGAGIKYRQLTRLQTHQFVYLRLNAWEGALAVVPRSFQGTYVTQEFPTFQLNISRADPDYVSWLCRWPELWGRMNRVTYGTPMRRKRLHPDQLLRVTVPLPDIPVQRRLAAMIEHTALRLGAALNLSDGIGGAFGQLYPALIDSILEHERYPLREIGQLVTFVSDLFEPGEDPAPAETFVGLQHIESHTGRRIGQAPLGGEKGSKKRFRPGDIVYGRLRPYLNKVWLADRHGLCSVDQTVLRPREGVSGVLVAHGLRSRRVLNEIIDLTHEAQLPRIRQEQLARMQIPVPADDLFPKVLDQLESARLRAQELVAENRGRADRLRAVVPSLLNTAFTGQFGEPGARS